MLTYRIGNVGASGGFVLSRKDRVYSFRELALEVLLQAEKPDGTWDEKRVLMTDLSGTYTDDRGVPTKLSFDTNVNAILRGLCQSQCVSVYDDWRGNLPYLAESNFQFIVWGEEQRQQKNKNTPDDEEEPTGGEW